MVKTHEVNLDTAEFAQFTNSDYLIMKIGDIAMMITFHYIKKLYLNNNKGGKQIWQIKE